MIRRPPVSTLFPYPTPFPSDAAKEGNAIHPCYLQRLVERQRRQDRRQRPRHHGLARPWNAAEKDRKSTRLNSSHANISYAVFCLKKKKAQGVHRQYHHVLPR